MGLFSPSRAKDDPFEAPAVVEPAPIPPFDPALLKSPDKLREYIMGRLYVESQSAPTAAGRISALKELGALALVSEEARYRIEHRQEVTVNLVTVSDMLMAARERTKREALALEAPAAEIPQVSNESF